MPSVASQSSPTDMLQRASSSSHRRARLSSGLLFSLKMAPSAASSLSDSPSASSSESIATRVRLEVDRCATNRGGCSEVEPSAWWATGGAVLSRARGRFGPQ